MSKHKKSEAPAGTPLVPDDAPARTDSDAPPPSPTEKPGEASDE